MTRCSETWWTVPASTSREHPWLLQQNEACVSGWWRIRNGRCNNENMALIFFKNKYLVGLLFIVKHLSSERWWQAVSYSSCARSSLLPGLRVCRLCRRKVVLSSQVMFVLSAWSSRVGLTLVRFTRISCLENPTIFKLIYEEYKTLHRNSYPCLR